MPTPCRAAIITGVLILLTLAMGVYKSAQRAPPLKEWVSFRRLRQLAKLGPYFWLVRAHGLLCNRRMAPPERCEDA